MGKALKIVAVVAAVAIVVFAPQISAALLAAIAVKSAIATALLTAAITIGVGMAVKALGVMPKPSAQVGPPGVFRQSIANSFIVYGKRRVGGLMVFFHPRKSGNDYFRYFVIACAGHRCKAVTKWYLNDEEVTVNGSNLVTSGVYANAAWLWFQRGLASETANATFVSECGGKWTTNHKGNGVSAIYAKFKMTEDVVQAGMPNITAEIEGRDEILDPRDDTTDYTNNGALVFYDWMKLPREEGGFGAYEDEIPDDDYISAQANVCDETVDSENRYELNGVIITGASPGEVRDTLIINVAGSYTYSGGKHLMRVGYWVPVSETLEEDDLAGAIQVSPFLASDAAANEVQGTYVNPDDGYQGAPFVTQTLTPAPTDIRQLDLDLAFTTSEFQAQRIARIMLRRAQCEKSAIWPMNIMGLRVKALDTVSLSTTRYGLGNYAWMVSNWGLSADWGTVLALREENEEIYSDDTPTTPDSVPTIDTADPILRPSEVSQLILNSFATDVDPADGLLQATDTTITVETHTRTYSDKAVSVTGDTLAVVAAEDFLNHVYYDDADRAGGAVTYAATTDPEDAVNGPANPFRHYVGSVLTDEVGGAGTSGGGSIPPGWSGGNWYNIP